MIPIYSNKEDEDKEIMHVWSFDSMKVNCMGITGKGCIGTDVVKWFSSNQATILKEKGNIFSMAFMHVPI